VSTPPALIDVGDSSVLVVSLTLMSIKGRNIIKDIGLRAILPGVGGRVTSYSAVVAPTKKFSHSELRNEVFYQEGGKWFLRCTGVALEAKDEEQVAEEVVSIAEMAATNCRKDDGIPKSKY
jgi:hypothetical protein